MRRQRQEEEIVNHERWVISYADFITLLFAFFVVMYSISSVNDGKYKVLSESLVYAFSSKDKSFEPIQIGTRDAKSQNQLASLIELPIPGQFLANDDYKYGVEGIRDDILPEEAQGEEKGGKDQEDYKEPTELNEIADQIATSMHDLVADGSLSIKANDLWIEVEIKSKILFGSGQARPQFEAADVMSKVADIVKQYPNPIHVEGFTDNIPIDNEIYPSNWELSTSRAAAIVRLLANNGVGADRLAAVGYGEHQPIADNATEEGRLKNRRVVLVISRDSNVRRSISAIGTDSVN